MIKNSEVYLRRSTSEIDGNRYAYYIRCQKIFPVQSWFLSSRGTRALLTLIFKVRQQPPKITIQMIERCCGHKLNECLIFLSYYCCWAFAFGIDGEFDSGPFYSSRCLNCTRTLSLPLPPLP